MADVRLRAGRYIALQKLYVTVLGLDEDTVTAHVIKTHLETADNHWSKLEDSHDKLLNTAADNEALTLQMDTLEPMQECYSQIKSELYRLQSRVTTVTTSSSHSKPFVKLPDMALPTFDGKYEDWPTFQDLFKASIHRNTTISGSHKLQYLKSCTKGEAASLIKSFLITDANYIEAWKLLESNYDIKREIIHAQVKKLLLQPALNTESATALQEMLTVTMESIRSLKVMGRPTDTWDDIITVLLIEKFDLDTKAEWARSLKGRDPPTFQELQDFIQQQIRTLHAKGSIKLASSRGHNGATSTRRVNTHHTSVQSCKHCKGSHQLFQCAKLQELQPEYRFTAVRSYNVCLNCLKDGHSYKKCQSSKCRKCSRPHNTLLHFEQQTVNKTVNNATMQQSAASSNNSGQSTSLPSSSMRMYNTTMASSNSPRLLKTALADVLDSNNIRRTVRVFIDEGGDGSLIKEATLNRLGLKRQRADVTINGVCGITASRSKWMTHVRLYSHVDNSAIDVELFSVPKVTDGINRLHSNTPVDWYHISGLRLADPLFYQGGDVDILIGADVAPYIIKPGLKKLDRNSPVAQDTIFGWVLTGNVMNTSQSSYTISNFKCEISDTLRKFWEMEEVPSQQSLTQEEQACEQHFKSTHSRLSDGRYVVRLPFNEKKQQLGGSRDQAYRRLQSLEKRFMREPQHKDVYVEFMREYEKLGHMEKVKSTPQAVNTFYLPHHFVLKADSTTTKQRTVYDGSSKTTSGISLNDTLMVGPTVQPDLFTLLLRFRYNKIALKADITKMYRQFMIHEDDRDYQRILFREETWLPVQEYRLTTVTYGTASAPFSATRCLNQLAEDEKQRYPAASTALLNQTYVDDLIASVATAAEAKELIEQLIGITAATGMEIRKWCSNDASVLQSLPEHLLEKCTISEFSESSTPDSIKALGIKWQPSTDEFSFTSHVSTTPPTKRNKLSEVAKTFDPLGWLAPVTINAKLLLQKVWLGGHNWDDMVPEELQAAWKQYQEDLSEVEKVRIPRCMVEDVPDKVELHGFCVHTHPDSSQFTFSLPVPR